MDMNATMLTEIQKQHDKCKRLAAEARDALKAVTSQALVVSALVEKASRHHRNNLHGYLSPVMNGVESRAYMTTYKASQCRDIGTDKRVLQALNVMEKAPARKRASASKSPASLTTRIAQANASISKLIKSRPVDELSKAEAEMAKEAMKPLAQLFVTLSNKAQ
ncbi:MAG: hypothetical protein ACPIA7_05450 [Akkermansiaceae bacterium]